MPGGRRSKRLQRGGIAQWVERPTEMPGGLESSVLQGIFPLCGHAKTLHTLTGMGSAALGAAVLYPGKVTRISRKG